MGNPYFDRNNIHFCQVPIPNIDDNKANSSVVFTADQISKYSQSQTHPSIYYNPSGWNGHKWWLASTPYPYATDVFENPCIYYADDNNGEPPVSFTPINGTASGDYTVINNPIVKVASNTATNSDPDLIVVDNVMYMISRNNPDNHSPFAQKSLNGQAWTPRDSNALWNNVELGLPELISPAFVELSNSKIRAYCCSGTSGINNINPSLATGVSWGIYMMEGTTFENGGDFEYKGKCYITGDKNVQPWHMDVILHDNIYYMLVCAKVIGSSSGSMQLFMATSTDGITFNMFKKPLLYTFAQYRPTLCITDNDALVIYGSTNSANPTSAELSGVTPAPDGRYIIMVTDALDNVMNALIAEEWTNA